MSLRRFHVFFILLAIVGADLFGVWSIWRFAVAGGGLTLALGLISIVGGVGLIFYAVHLVKMLDQAKVT